MIISVAERGTTVVGRDDWAILSEDSHFWKLVSDNIIQVESFGLNRWKLKGTCYVGRACIGNKILQINEKFPGALDTLVRLGALQAPKIERVPAPVTPTPNSTGLLVTIFLQSVKVYLSGSKKSQYTKQPETGALVGGRLDMTRTAALRARGMFHKAAFDRTVLSADVPLNRCVYAALREIERLSRTSGIPSALTARARALRLGLSECLVSVLASTRTELAKIAAQEAQDPRNRKEARDVASLAGAILDAAGFGGSEYSTKSVERSWFVNLETFFEEAVRRIVREILDGSVSVTGPINRPSLFDPDQGRYRANPDVVMRQGLRTLAIADAKYKDFTSWPSSSDVHEIVAHAAAYHTKIAVLFYPDEARIGIRSLGTASTGCRLWAVGLSFTNMIEDIREGLIAAGVTVGISADA